MTNTLSSPTHLDRPRRAPRAVTCLGLLSLLGWLAYPWAIEYLPTRAAGLSGLAFPWLVEFLSRTNPLRWLDPVAPTRPYFYPGFVFWLCYVSVCYFAVMYAARRRQASVTLRSILFWIALFSVPLLLVPDMFSSDVYAYIMLGRLDAVHGANPTVIPPMAFPSDPLLQYMPGWTGVPAYYGPVWLLFSHGLTLFVHLFGQTPQLYVFAYKVTAIGLHMANAVLIWRILGRWKPEQQARGTLLYAWNPLALMEFAGSGHNDVMLVFFLLLSLWAAQQNHWRRATVALSLSALTKFVPVILLPPYAVFLARQRTSWKSRLAIVGQAAGISLLTAVLVYVPYWEGGRTVDAGLGGLATVTATKLNSVGELVDFYLPKVISAGSPGEKLSAAPGDQGGSAEPQPGAGQPANSEAFVRLVRWFGWLLLPALRLMANPWSGRVAMLLVWLWVCYYLWRQPSFGRLVIASFWCLLSWLLCISVSFWPWYATWPLAVAALLNWKPAGRLMVVFTTLAWVLYLFWGSKGLMLVYAPVYALIAWHLWGALRTGLANSTLAGGRLRRLTS